MSRAQALLIIIGDPKTLRTDENWNKVVNVFEENNAIIPSNGKVVHNRTNLVKHLDTLQLNEEE